MTGCAGRPAAGLQERRSKLSESDLDERKRKYNRSPSPSHDPHAVSAHASPRQRPSAAPRPGSAPLDRKCRPSILVFPPPSRCHLLAPPCLQSHPRSLLPAVPQPDRRRPPPRGLWAPCPRPCRPPLRPASTSWPGLCLDWSRGIASLTRQRREKSARSGPGPCARRPALGGSAASRPRRGRGDQPASGTVRFEPPPPRLLR